MNTRHQRTLEAIFTEPTLKNIKWRNVEALFIYVGTEVIEGKGSRVKFYKNDIIATFHRPHPGKEAKPYQVRDARLFLTRIGIIP